MNYNVHSVLSTDGFIQLNKSIIKKVGLTASAVLGELISKEKYYNDRNMLDDEGMFFCLSSDFEEMFNVKRKPIETSRKTLEEVGFIATKRKGIPAKMFYKINHENIHNYLFSNRVPKKDKQGCDKQTTDNQQSAQKGQTGVPKKDKQECPKRTNRSAQKGQTINKNIGIRSENKKEIIINKEDIFNLNEKQRRAFDTMISIDFSEFEAFNFVTDTLTLIAWFEWKYEKISIGNTPGQYQYGYDAMNNEFKRNSFKKHLKNINNGS